MQILVHCPDTTISFDAAKCWYIPREDTSSLYVRWLKLATYIPPADMRSPSPSPEQIPSRGPSLQSRKSTSTLQYLTIRDSSLYGTVYASDEGSTMMTQSFRGSQTFSFLKSPRRTYSGSQPSLHGAPPLPMRSPVDPTVFGDYPVADSPMPMTPTSDFELDELRVKEGDIFNVVQVFDDGWALVKKLSREV